PIFIQRLYEQIQDYHYLEQLCRELSKTKLKQILIRKFKNTRLVENVLYSISEDVSSQAKAEEFFYGSEISRKDISDFFNGFFNLALDLGKLVVLCLDEVQFLIDIDPTQALVKIILEQFIRKLYEQYKNKKLYIVISCLQNPDKREYDVLKGISKNFQSIVEGKEIILGNLTLSEKDAILNQVCDKINLEGAERKKFLSQVKGRLEYYLPRELLKSVAEILDMMGYTSYSPEELRTLYESEARAYVKPILLKKGFVYLEDKPKKIGGYNIDIYASAETNRYQRTPKAVGEVTIIQRKAIKEKVEKFAAWLHQMKGKEYRPDLGDYAFFICPSNRLTKSSVEILRSNNIDIIEFDSSLINEINQLDQEPALTEEKELPPVPTPEEPPTQSANLSPESSLKPKLIIGKKHIAHKLQDIPGVGAAKVKLLKQANILTIEDLINCNPCVIAGKIKGLGLKSLTKWIQRAKQIVNE
ncbi:MAG: helix-hairpin-helix domain-containing protein, partial [Candidatus Helarchaeota archaeon]